MSVTKKRAVPQAEAHSAARYYINYQRIPAIPKIKPKTPLMHSVRITLTL